MITQEILGAFTASQWKTIRSVLHLQESEECEKILEHMEISGLNANINKHAYGTLSDEDFDAKPIVSDYLPLPEPNLEDFFATFS